jgi:hypothetical protein
VPDKDHRAVQKVFLKPEEVADYLRWTLEEVQSLIAKGVLSTVKDWQADTYPSILYGVFRESLISL